MQRSSIADLGMATVINTEISINRKMMREISYIKMVLRKMLHSCKDVDNQPIQVRLVREILHEDTIPPILFTFPLIIVRGRNNQVFQPNDIHRLKNVRWTRKQ